MLPSMFRDLHQKVSWHGVKFDGLTAFWILNRVCSNESFQLSAEVTLNSGFYFQAAFCPCSQTDDARGKVFLPLKLIFLGVEIKLYVSGLVTSKSTSQDYSTEDGTFVVPWSNVKEVNLDFLLFEGKHKFAPGPGLRYGPELNILEMQALGRGFDIVKAQWLEDYYRWVITPSDLMPGYGIFLTHEEDWNLYAGDQKQIGMRSKHERHVSIERDTLQPPYQISSLHWITPYTGYEIVLNFQGEASGLLVSYLQS